MVGTKLFDSDTLINRMFQGFPIRNLPDGGHCPPYDLPEPPTAAHGASCLGCVWMSAVQARRTGTFLKPSWMGNCAAHRINQTARF